MATIKKIAAQVGVALPALPTLPPPPYIHRAPPPHGSVTVTPNGCGAVKLWATRGKTFEAIAGELGIAQSTARKLMGAADDEPPTDARLAYESGKAAHKSSLIEKLTEKALAGSEIASFFLLKACHNLRDQGPQTVIDNAARIQFVLPGSMTQAEYYKKLGIDGPIDTRDTKLIREHMSQRGQTETEITDYLKKIGRE
jgi:hypothetical protein